MVRNLLTLEQEVARTSGQASTIPDIQIRDLTSNQKFIILNGSLFSVAHRYIFLEIIKKAKLRVNAAIPSRSQLHKRQILQEPIRGSTVSFFVIFFAFTTFSEPQRPNTS